MHKTIARAAQCALAVTLALALLLTGCSTGPKAAQPTAETGPAQAAPTKEPEPTGVVEPTAEPQAAPEDAGERIDNALDNLLKLAPLHLVSYFEYKQGDDKAQTSRFEGDVDANGNQHMFLYVDDGESVELYIVDGTMYLGGGEGQFLAMGEAPEGSTFAFLGLYGGAYLLSYNQLEDAKRLGSESVNGFDCDKYQVRYDLSTAGLSGAIAQAQGVEWEYEAFAWIEKGTRALVRARVDWKGKSSADAEVSTYHSEFDATRGTVKEIKAPEKVMSFGQ
ncbi:MAG: hypothetical protein K6V36_14905 [Anaerolineae bacterium]|nr:hypothetical protein [Anaerolineae bacterium]